MVRLLSLDFTNGHFIGGGEIVQNDNLKLHLDPYDYGSMGANGATDDDGKSHIRDLSAYENDMILKNDADSKSQGHWSFDGTDDFAYIADDSDFDIGTADFTIQMWVKLTTTNDVYLFSKWSSHTGYHLYYYNNSMRMRMNSTLVNYDNTFTWTDNWVNVAVSCDRDGDSILYHNGVVADDDYGDPVTSTISTPHNIYISGFSSTSTTTTDNPLTGYVGPVMFYNGIALNANQINQNFDVYRGIYGI